MAAFVLNTVKSQLPMLIEKFEPELEAGLRSSLQSMKAQHPEEINLFFANWKKLDAAVRAELGGAPIVGRGRGKRTRRVHRRSRK
jgi:hypothetical protein